jgi:ankyrin repeat protein
MLLETQGLDIDFETKDSGYSPLCAACMAGHLEAVEILAEHGANTNFKSKMG